MSNRLPLIELSGSPRERGRAHGEAFRDVIGEIYIKFIEDLLQPPEDKPHSLTSEWCMEWARGHIPHLSDYTHDLLEEVKGIAEGAKLSVEEVILLNGFLAIADWASPTFQKYRLAQSGGCTSFGISGHLRGGKAIIGQNYDLESFYQPSAILLRVKSEGVPDALVFTIAGIIGGAGINAAGVAVAINNLIPNDSHSGVLYPFLVRKLIQAPDPGTAIDAVLFPRRASGLNYVIAGESGVVITLETSATDYAVIDGSRCPVAHANNYVCEKMLRYEARWIGERGQSIFRNSRMNHLLHGDGKHLDLECCKHILSDHANYPIAICRHDYPPGTCGKTICGMIFNPSERKMYVSAGNPCENTFEEYEV